ncbi:hypothetical protein HK098_007213 [Nowakowskiella sp. JEL0407]|nr:hypothetical protein HK098_007213 [Nowakowskiella sp. JEL0407]
MFSFFTHANPEESEIAKAKTKFPLTTAPDFTVLSHVSPLPEHSLSAEQESALQELTSILPEIVSTVDSHDNEANYANPEQKQEVKSQETEWLNRNCLLRYLRATKWNVHAAVVRLEATLNWRREYKPLQIAAEEVEPEAESGKIFINGFDLHGRPIIHLFPQRENTKTYDRQIRYVVYTLEKAIKMMPEGVEQVTILVDYEHIQMSNATPLSVSRKFLQVLGDHYPERFGMGVLINPGYYLYVLFKLIGPFMDPVTKSKIHFCNLKKQAEMHDLKKTSDDHSKHHKSSSTWSSMIFGSHTGDNDHESHVEGMGGWTDLMDYIHPSDLLIEFGGEKNYEINHEKYWGSLTKI